MSLVLQGRKLGNIKVHGFLLSGNDMDLSSPKRERMTSLDILSQKMWSLIQLPLEREKQVNFLSKMRFCFQIPIGFLDQLQTHSPLGNRLWCMTANNVLAVGFWNRFQYNGGMQKQVEIIKANGEREFFDDGMTTDHIYRHAFSVLKDVQNPRAIRRYSLRRALIDLGPTGFPFERFLAKLFASQGFEVKNDQILQGRCVPHEVDLVAYNENKLVMVESKFHNRMGEKSDVKVALYVKARFDDLSEQLFDYGKARPLDEGWLVTNTKFTENAIKFGVCAGLKMVGWNYPEKGSMRDLIEDSRLHPVTCLPSLTKEERELLLNNDMVLCSQILDSQSKLIELGIKREKVTTIAAEAEALCGR